MAILFGRILARETKLALDNSHLPLRPSPDPDPVGSPSASWGIIGVHPRTRARGFLRADHQRKQCGVLTTIATDGFFTGNSTLRIWGSSDGFFTVKAGYSAKFFSFSTKPSFQGGTKAPQGPGLNSGKSDPFPPDCLTVTF